MNKHSRGFAYLFLIIVVVLVGIIAIGYFAIKNGQIKFTKTPAQQSISPSPTQPLNTTNWKTYINEEYNFTINYPLSYLVREVDQVEIEDPLLTVFFENKENIFTERITVSIYTKSNLESFVENNIEPMLIGHITDNIENKTSITIGDSDGIKLEYKEYSGESYILRSTFLTNSETYTYLITTDADMLNQILSTFRFIDTVTLTTSKTEYVKGQEIAFTINNNTDYSIYYSYGCSRPSPHLILEEKSYPLVTTITENVPPVIEIKPGESKSCSWDQKAWSDPGKSSPEKYREFLDKGVVSSGAYRFRLDYYLSEEDARLNSNPSPVFSQTINTVVVR